MRAVGETSCGIGMPPVAIELAQTAQLRWWLYYVFFLLGKCLLPIRQAYVSNLIV